MDRGFDPIGVLKDMMNRKNVTFIMGNHDYLFYHFLKTIGLELLDFKSEDEKWDFRTWIKDGGLSTLDGYIDLPEKEKKEIYDYIEKAKSYVTLEFEGKKYSLYTQKLQILRSQKSLMNIPY